MTTEKDYENILRGKKRKVIFGITIFEPERDVVDNYSAEGKISNTHNDFSQFKMLFRLYGDHGSLRSWRYVPDDNVIFWWEKPEPELQENVEYFLKRKYKVKDPVHKRIYSYVKDTKQNKLARLLSHGPEFAYGVGHPKQTMPSFKDYLKYTQKQYHQHEGD